MEEAGQLHQAELDGYSEAQLATLKHVQALEDEAIAQKKAADAAKEAARAFEEAQDQGDRILGRSPADRAREKAALYGIDIGDISSAAGRDSVVAALRVMYQNDPTNKALADHIETVIGLLESIDFGGGPIGASGATSAGAKGATSSLTLGYQSLTTGQGSILADLQRQSVGYLKSIDATLLPLRGSISAAGVATAGVGASIRFTNTFHIHSGAEDVGAVAREVSAIVVRKISEQLGRDLQIHKLRTGNVSVAS
jgi:hypothetical protein